MNVVSQASKAPRQPEAELRSPIDCGRIGVGAEEDLHHGLLSRELVGGCVALL